MFVWPKYGASPCSEQGMNAMHTVRQEIAREEG